MRAFEYQLIPVADWQIHLEQFASSPSKTFSMCLLWGDHEAIKGVRDFHSKPRLKIEKIFTLAHSLGLSIDIAFGFPSNPKAFPEWVWAMEPKTQVPLFNEQGLSRWEFKEVPSLKNQEVKEGFLAFLEEALSILKLHTGSCGSVRSVSFDWGIFERECPHLETTKIVERLKQRYETPQRLNLVFQTNFKDFNAAATPSGFKTLSKKRPWLIFWDYKALRKELFRDWEVSIQEYIGKHGLVSSPKCAPEKAESFQQHAMVLDDTFLNAHPNLHEFYPLIFQGELDPFLVRAFRLAEILTGECGAENESLEPLSSWRPRKNLKTCSVFCQTFLPRNTFDELSRFLDQGGRVFFPFGLPKWDETMDPLEWDSALLKGSSPGLVLGNEVDVDLNSLYQKARNVFA